MSKELVVSSNRHETRVAVLEDDLLTEIYFQRQQEYSLAGSIHKGRVTRVLPGMQSAFVDLGLERDTFLYVSDFFEENEDFDPVPSDREARPGRDREHRTPREDRPARAVTQPREVGASIVEAAPEVPDLPESETSPEVSETSPEASPEMTRETAPASASAAPQHDRGNRNDRGDR